jgi:hypothetical protein
MMKTLTLEEARTPKKTIGSWKQEVLVFFFSDGVPDPIRIWIWIYNSVTAQKTARSAAEKM